MQRDGDAVAHHGDIANHFFNSANCIGGCSGRLRLRILSGRRRAGEKLDKVAGDSCAIRRYEVGTMLGGKIVGDNVMVAVMAGQDEIRTLAFKMPREQQFGIGNTDNIWMRSVGVNYGRTGTVTTLRRRRVSH